MFDTSVVRPAGAAAPRRFGLLTASIAIHSAAIVGAIGLSIASVDFPRHAPGQMEILRPTSVPPALGDGREPGPKPRPAEPVKKVEVPRADPVVVPPVDDPLPEPVTSEPVDLTTAPQSSEVGARSVPGTDGGGSTTGGSGTGDGTGGSPLGDPNGIGNGDPGLMPGSGPLVPGGEVRAARVLRRVEPRYPQAMIVARIRTAVVTVRGVIDRNGRLRNAEVVTSSYAPFNEAVLDSIKQWTFAPGTLRGEPVDTWFELTVRFQVR